MPNLSAFTAGDIIKAARDRSPWFDRSRIPDGPCARMLSTIFRELGAKIALRDPWAQAQNVPVDITIAQILAAIGPPRGITTFSSSFKAMWIVGITVTFTDPTREPEILRQVPYELLEKWSGRGFVWQEPYIIPTGTVSDWSSVATLTTLAIGTSGNLDSPGVTLGGGTFFPEIAQDAFIERLAEKFAIRLNGTPVSTEEPDMSQLIRLDVATFSRNADKSESALLQTMTRRENQIHITIPNGVEFEP